MEIINPNLIPITAFDALNLVREIKTEQDRQLKKEYELLEANPTTNEKNLQHEQAALTKQLNPENLDQLIDNFLIHFESNPHLPQSKQSSKSILNLCESLRNQFGQVSGRINGLAKAERLQICDLAPTELVEIYLIIEECDSRFTEPEIEAILELVKQNLSSERQVGTRRTNEVRMANGDQNHVNDHQDGMDEDAEINLGDFDDDEALVAEAREGGPAPDQELDEVPD